MTSSDIAETKAIVKSILDAHEIEVDVTEDVRRELDRRLLIVTKHYETRSAALADRCAKLEAAVEALKRGAGVIGGVATTPSATNRLAAIAAANQKALAAAAKKPGTTGLRVTFGAKKGVAA